MDSKQRADAVSTQNAETSAPSVIDRIVDQNDALWNFLRSENQPREERMALLKRAFPGSKELDGDAA